ncbi:MAG: septum formation protein Maf [Ruminococcaceae bacterium]|nr:septum formation protein Maf [Oscillospiraceae bacterium]
MTDIQFILASGSPRRREILAALGIPFTVRVAETDESCDILDPGARVEAISEKKCMAVQKLLESEGALKPGTLILASDTLVTLDGVFLGKPEDTKDACRMVSMLSGRGHTVASGIAVWYGGRLVTAHELTTVYFSSMTAEDIDAYVATGEPMGKAGAYAIQGQAAKYIQGIEGDYFNVVGLPVRRLYTTLKEAFDLIL